MKLKKLTIHNIASIEDAVIDFEHGPLAEESQFLICGPTGAGKTTLLDAICMVLYGTTPRLSGMKREDFDDKNDSYKGRDMVKTDDPRMLLRKGAVSATIELLFADKDDNYLNARWYCYRAHKKMDGAIQDPQWTLEDADKNEVISSKKTEVVKIIQDRIGLTFEQFCRTTMLAQGEFTKFLKSTGGEKSEILEKLTGTDVYSEVGKLIYAKKSEKEGVYKQIQSRLEGVKLLTDEEKEMVLQQQKEYKAQADELAAREQRTAVAAAWMEQRAKQALEDEQARKAYQSQLAVNESDACKQLQKLLADYDRTQAPREAWRRRAEAHEARRQGEQKVERLKQDYAHLCAGMLHLQNRIEEVERERQRLETYLRAEETNRVCYSQIALIESWAKSHRQLAGQVVELEKNIGQKTQELGLLDEAIAEGKKQVEAKEAIAVEKQRVHQEALLQLEAMDQNALLVRNKELNARRNALTEFRSKVEGYRLCSKSLADKQQELTGLQAEIAKRCEEQVAAEASLKEIQEQVSVQQVVYDKQELACKNLMKEYRSRLAVGDVCPLCGQQVVSLATDEHFVSVLQPVKQLLDQLKVRQQEAEKLLSDVKGTLSASRRNEVARQRELEDLQKREGEARAELTAHPSAADYANREHPIEAVDADVAKVNTEISDVEARLKEVAEWQKRMEVMRKDKESCDKQLHDAEKALKNLEMKQVSAREVCTAKKNDQAVAQHNLEETEKSLAGYIDLNRYKEQGDAYIDQLKTSAANYDKAGKQSQQLDAQQQQLNAEQQHAKTAREAVEQLCKGWISEEVLHPEPMELLAKKWADLQANVTAHIAEMKRTQEVYERADGELKGYWQHDDAVDEENLARLAMKPFEEMNRLRNEQRALSDALLACHTRLKTAEANLKEMDQNRPEMDAEATLESLRNAQQALKAELNERNQTLGALLQKLEQDQQNRREFEKEGKRLAEAKHELQRWTRLCNLFGSADGKCFRNIAQSYVLEQLLNNSNHYLRQFTDRYEMLCSPGTLTVVLRDKEAGGTLRPVTTISGGESFLLSLSLALGLSSLTRASFSVDTLFIDEGFGTLDSSYLSSVMDALERLHQMDGKRIGIISHVESLKERITTQIQVEKVNSTLSKVSVVSLV